MSAEPASESERESRLSERMVESGLQIVAYCCEHCAYAAADLAGGLRIQYPPQVKVVQLPCTGKLDELMVLQALEDGIDGVLVAG
jgi:F420-non-reducing hydrogenase iron-sulfur subunit